MRLTVRESEREGRVTLGERERERGQSDIGRVGRR